MILMPHGNQYWKPVFKMAKSLLEIGASDEDIYSAKIKLAEELKIYDKVKNDEQIKALVDFLEYLFLIQDPSLENKYEEYKRVNGGAFKMTVDEIRKLHYKGEGKEEERMEIAKNLLDILSDDMISKKTGLPIDTIKTLRENAEK